MQELHALPTVAITVPLDVVRELEKTKSHDDALGFAARSALRFMDEGVASNSTERSGGRSALPIRVQSFFETYHQSASHGSSLGGGCLRPENADEKILHWALYLQALLYL